VTLPSFETWPTVAAGAGEATISNQASGNGRAWRRRRNTAAPSRPTTTTEWEGSPMTTAIIFHEVQDGAIWAKAWKQGPGSRHEMFGRLGITCRNFRDPNNPNSTGVMAEIPDLARFQELLQSDEGRQAMREDGLKVETMRMLVEFTP
jgi:hypothetical protein